MAQLNRAGLLARPLLVGADVEVSLVTGARTRYVNLDYAASAPALLEVVQAVQALLPWYSSVHRGAGLKSQVATAAYEGARQAVHRFVNGRPDDALVFTRNTTDAINLLAGSLPEGTRVLAFAVEHHANLLPWRQGTVQYLPVPSSPADLLEHLDGALAEPHAGPSLVAATGASNVTGEIWPMAEIVALAHRRGARVLMDAAQLAPHAPIDVAALDVDYVAFSGHKLYAPFGAGVLLGRPDWLEQGAPYLRGGGAVDFVTLDDVLWTTLPDRQEAGSPNVVGAVALGAACQALQRLGMARLAREEAELQAYARQRLGAVPGLVQYAAWDPDQPRVGILPFNLTGYPHALVATVLSAEHGIGVRHGCFCAHPLMLHLLQVDPCDAEVVRAQIQLGNRQNVPGAVRISFGLDTTREHLDRAAEALTALAADGPRWRYERSASHDEYRPSPDPRVWPDLPVPLARD